MHQYTIKILVYSDIIENGHKGLFSESEGWTTRAGIKCVKRSQRAFFSEYISDYCTECDRGGLKGLIEVR